MFEHIYWDTLSKKHNLSGLPGDYTLHAIWPSPVDSDVCFEAAGFTEFEDSDSDWDANWETLVERVVSTLCRYGDPMIQNPVTALVPTSIWDRIRTGRLRNPEADLTLVEQIVLTTTDDQFQRAVVSFGVEPKLTLICGDGRPILWLRIERKVSWSLEALVDTISLDCQQQRRKLDWQHLIPSASTQ